jgi:hypothetical protein
MLKVVKNILVRSGMFRLLGRKAHQASDTGFDVARVDVSEQPPTARTA